MKRLIYAFVAVFMLLLTACNEGRGEHLPGTNEFSNDVINLVNQFIQNTRSSTNSLPFECSEEFRQMIINVNHKYNIEEKIAVSDYYKNNLPSSNDFYHYYNWIEKNGTKSNFDFIERIFIFEDTSVTIDEILESKELLINEKIALSVLTAYLREKHFVANQNTRASKQECMDIYNNSVKRCNRTYAISLAASVASGFVSAGASLIGLGGSYLNHQNCLKSASESYNTCIKYADK